MNCLKLPLQIFAWHNINLTTLAIDACAIPFVLVGAYLGIRLVKFLPEREVKTAYKSFMADRKLIETAIRHYESRKPHC